MGLLDDAATVISGRSSKHHHQHSHSHHRRRSRSRSGSRSRSRSRSRYGAASVVGSLFGIDDGKHNHSSKHHHHHHSSRSSFFGLPNVSRSSFFGFSRPSYYKRSPRPNFVSRAYRHVKRLLRDLLHYAKRHPVKVFMLVIAPLITGGALTALLAFFGLRLPSGIERALGLGAKAMSGDSVGLVGEALRMAGGLGSAGGKVSVERGHGPGGASWERRHWEQDLSYGDDEYGFGRSASGGGSWGSVVGGLGGLGGVAKMFL